MSSCMHHRRNFIVCHFHSKYVFRKKYLNLFTLMEYLYIDTRLVLDWVSTKGKCWLFVSNSQRSLGNTLLVWRNIINIARIAKLLYFSALSALQCIVWIFELVEFVNFCCNYEMWLKLWTFGRKYCDILSKRLWNLSKIVKFGQIFEMFAKMWNFAEYLSVLGGYMLVLEVIEHKVGIEVLGS